MPASPGGKASRSMSRFSGATKSGKGYEFANEVVAARCQKEYIPAVDAGYPGRNAQRSSWHWLSGVDVKVTPVTTALTTSGLVANGAF